ncbi:phage tail protein [Chitinophaga japonensis]|uniref:Phage tail-like protein n=1 Tax=Chitinophaga japonensis TaxID=104662 RepID=A0A562STJ7_CHIJA|nr:phage tail protein [Chitinophaga japonensis]TWI84532.1 phage tail-like protein [Chitinophaga japonensis]
MADLKTDGSTQSAAIWPLVRFSFKVLWDKTEIIFQEVTGLTSETQVIEYRGGSSPVYSTVKMPGIQKFNNITFKKGTFQTDNTLWTLYAGTNGGIKMNTIKRTSVTISLLDENQQVAMSWTLKNAFPVKVQVTDMKSDANEPAIETMEVAHEGLALVAQS